MLEYYYWSGLPVSLSKLGLGVIYPIRFKEYIERNMRLETIIYPFTIRKEMMIGDNEDFNKILMNIGDLGFLYLIDSQNNNKKIENSLIESLKVLYRIDDIYVNPKTLHIHIGDIEVDKDKFTILSDIVLEMFKMDKPKFEKKEEDEYDRRRREYQELVNKAKKGIKDDVGLIDVANILVHEGHFSYDDVLNMTIYQIKNSFETLKHKQSFDISMMYKVSPKYDVKEDVGDWHMKKIIKNSSITKA